MGAPEFAVAFPWTLAIDTACGTPTAGGEAWAGPDVAGDTADAEDAVAAVVAVTAVGAAAAVGTAGTTVRASVAAWDRNARAPALPRRCSMRAPTDFGGSCVARGGAAAARLSTIAGRRAVLSEAPNEKPARRSSANYFPTP